MKAWRGVIIHGKNGFLCEAGNSKELATIVEYIRGLTNEERKRISDAAMATSLKLTDVIVAEDYINTVIKYGKKIACNQLENVHEYHSMQFGNKEL